MEQIKKSVIDLCHIHFKAADHEKHGLGQFLKKEAN